MWVQSWAPAEIFVGGGGRKAKKGPRIEKKASNIVKKAPDKEKNVAKRPPYPHMEKR